MKKSLPEILTTAVEIATYKFQTLAFFSYRKVSLLGNPWACPSAVQYGEYYYNGTLTITVLF